MENQLDPLVVTRDRMIEEAVLASAAAAGASVAVTHDLDDVRRHWRHASLVLVGADSAALVAASGLAGRPGVHIIGREVDELASWSVPLGASIIPLGQSAATLAGLLSESGVTKRASTWWVVGGSGGVGASTLCAALAIEVAKSSTVAVVELSPRGGGIDLIFGGETEQGWRWPDLRTAVGQLGSLRGRVPQIHGVDVVSAGREYCSVPAEALAAVVESLRRSHEIVLLDGGWARPPSRDFRVALMVGADVRGVASALATMNDADITDAEVLVAAGPGRSIAPDLVVDALGAQLLDCVPYSKAVPRLQESGRAPTNVSGRYGRVVKRLAKEVCDA